MQTAQVRIKTVKSKRWVLFSLVILLLTFAVVETMNRVDANQPVELKISRENNQSVLSTTELGTFYQTARNVSDARSITLPESETQVFTWQEEGASGSKLPFYAITSIVHAPAAGV